MVNQTKPRDQIKARKYVVFVPHLGAENKDSIQDVPHLFVENTQSFSVKIVQITEKYCFDTSQSSFKFKCL